MKGPRRAKIEAAHLRQLKALLRAILPRNRFYAHKLKLPAAKLTAVESAISAQKR